MFCPNCGNNVNDGAKFCANCGYNFETKTVSKPDHSQEIRFSILFQLSAHSHRVPEHHVPQYSTPNADHPQSTDEREYFGDLSSLREGFPDTRP